MKERVVLEGCVVDQACLREYPQRELFDRARVHTTAFAFLGHCIESGYGLVNAGGRLQVLEPAATAQVVEVLRSAARSRGVHLPATREMRGGAMHVVRIEETAT